ncbi:hypothetical protein K488DRAFT_39053, partial [Vararia minispora EC-137]
HQHTDGCVPLEQYRYALTNFRIAHEKVEEQRAQLQQQEQQVAQLRERIAVLEGATLQATSKDRRLGGSSVDDFTIKNAASKLERLINRWASDILRSPPAALSSLRTAILSDILGGEPDASSDEDARPMIVQSLLRHALAETVCEDVINCLVVTSSTEANIQLARIHEHIFARDPTVAAVWRRQTFSAAVESISPKMTASMLSEHLPTLCPLLGPHIPSAQSVLESAIAFSRTLHSSTSSTSASGAGGFFRAFVPERGVPLSARQIELVKRCIASEHGEGDVVGATIFPGLVKVSQGGPGGESKQDIVRRAQVICECALQA